MTLTKPMQQRALQVVLVLAAVGCGSSNGKGTDAGSVTDAGSSPPMDAGPVATDAGTDAGPMATDAGTDAGAAATDAGTEQFPFPVVGYHGGPLITAPEIVTVTFPGDSLTTQLAAFGASVASTSYWDTIRSGYCGGSSCVGDGPAGTAVALTAAPATSYTDSTQGDSATLQTFLAGLITGGQVPTPDANTIYALYFPTTTSISLDGSLSCQDFDGYHNGMTVGSQQVYYSVIPECPAPQMTPAITLLQNTTITASHEFIETATDPGNLAAFYLDVKHANAYGWDDIQGGEVADLCVDPFGLGQDETTENGYTVQRVWSIANAAAGKNPCVPIPAGEVYFNTYSEYSVVVLDVGQSATLTVTALADGTMASWTLTPQDWTSPDGSTTYLSFAIAGGTAVGNAEQISVQSGDQIQLTVTLLVDPADAPYDEADAVLVSANASTSADVTAAHFWPFIVLTPAEAAQDGITMMRRPEHVHAGAHRRGWTRGLLGH